MKTDDTTFLRRLAARIGAAMFASFSVVAAALVLGALPSTASADDESDESIEGFWQVTWTDATTKAVVLNVWDVWHGDHTETQNDTGPVLAGFVCQGAWISLGKHTFGLTHPSFNYLVTPEGQEGVVDTTSSTLILEKVTVAHDGKTFTGTGIIKTISGIDPFNGSVIGTPENILIEGKRVTVDKSQLP
jgi:hypothetical protein